MLNLEVHFACDWRWTLLKVGIDVSANLRRGADLPRWVSIEVGLLFAWIRLHIASKRVAEVCPNCDCAMPDGCEGEFSSDGVSCWLNRSSLGKTGDRQ